MYSADLVKNLTFCPKNIVEDLTVIHYGAKTYNSSMVRPIEDNFWIKPKGGLWTSPINSEYGWKEWCDKNEYQCNKDNSFKLKFKPDTRIIMIDSYEDLEKLPKYDKNIGGSKEYYVEFETLSEVAHAVWLTEKGQQETHFSKPFSLYGWDVECILIMYPNCCYQVNE